MNNEQPQQPPYQYSQPGPGYSQGSFSQSAPMGGYAQGAPGGMPYAQPAPANGPGIASLVLGIISVALWWIFAVGPYITLVAGIVGIILAANGMKRTNGKGLAIAGLVLSIIGTVISGCLVAAALAIIGSLSHL